MYPYDDMTNADVMSPAEMAEYDRDAEFALDAAQEQEGCDDGTCVCFCVDTTHSCGCDCPHDGDCDCEDCTDAEYGDRAECEDTEEWQPGDCDHCGGSTAADLERAANGPGLTPVCACAIGQGAGPENCRCGPPAGDA